MDSAASGPGYGTSTDATSSSKPFPPLAVELVRSIVQVAAQDDKKAALALALVSKVVNKWITPILYHTLILPHEDQIASFHETLWAHGADIGQLVHRIFIQAELQDFEDEVFYIICNCPQLECLSTNDDIFDIFYAKIGKPEPPPPSPWHMMLHFLSGRTVEWNWNHPLMRNVTHLYVEAINIIMPLQSLATLTHMGVTCCGDSEQEEYTSYIKSWLSSSTLLLLLLRTVYVLGEPPTVLLGDIWTELSQIEDRRLVAGPVLPEPEYMRIVESGGTIWDDAEAKFKDWRSLVVPSAQQS